jgi:hypothetical protein
MICSVNDVPCPQAMSRYYLHHSVSDIPFCTLCGLATGKLYGIYNDEYALN